MTNKFAGQCRTCTQRVEKGAGVYTGALYHTQCVPTKTVAAPVAPAATPRAFSIDRIYSLESFEKALNEQTDLLEMLRIQLIIKKMNRLDTKHPLNHTLDGYKRAFVAINKRAAQLGFRKRNSDGTFYIPLPVVAEKAV